MRGSIGLAAGLLVLATTATAADTPVAREPVFQPQTTSAFRHLGGPGPYYPARAARQRLTGSATLQCHAAASGALTDCRALAEQPQGADFAAAALAMARKGWLTAAPRLEAGPPVDGEQVVVTVPFQVPGR